MGSGKLVVITIRGKMFITELFIGILFLGTMAVMPMFAVGPLTGLGGRTILIDPGHGGVDGGAVAGPVLEKNLNLDISLKLRDILEENGAIVYMTRDSDTSLDKAGPVGNSRHRRDLSARIWLSYAIDPDVFVSIHMNASRSSRVSGPSVFHRKGSVKGERLATAILGELEGIFGRSRHGIMTKDLHITRKNTCEASALVEVGFITNPSDLTSIIKPEYQERIAMAIARGIVEYTRGEPDIPLPLRKPLAERN